jgi:toxin ParE1/3/4
MKCLFTARAEADLEAIAEYIALDSTRRALDFIQKLRKRCEDVCQAPEGYKQCPEYGEGVRKVPYGNYVIFYTLDFNSVVILHIAHSAKLA